MPGNDLSATRAKIPTSGVTATATAQANVSQVLTDIIDDLEPNITPSQIDMSSNLSFLYNAAYYAATDLGYVNFQDRTATPAVNESLYVQTDELYFRDGAGNDVQMTSSGTLNAAALGGITGGGYGASGVELNWNGTQYRFKDGAGAFDMAPVVASHFHLRDGAGNDIANTVPTLSAGYTLTWPAAVSGGATRALQSDASGNLAWSNTYSEDITLSGSAELKHGNRILYLPATTGWRAGSPGGTLTSTSGEVTVGAAATRFFMPLPLRAGDRIVDIYAYINGGDTNAKRFSIFSKLTCDGTAATEDDFTTDSSSGTATVSWTGINYTVNSTAVANALWFVFTTSTGVTTDRIMGIRVIYDRP